MNIIKRKVLSWVWIRWINFLFCFIGPSVYKTDPAGYYSSFKVGLLIICNFIIKRSCVFVKIFPGNMHVHVPLCILYNWYRFQQQQKGPNPDLIHGQKTHNPQMQWWTFESTANTKNKIMPQPRFYIHTTTVEKQYLYCGSGNYGTVTTRNNIRASSVVALYSMSTISELTRKSGNTFI